MSKGSNLHYQSTNRSFQQTTSDESDVYLPIISDLTEIMRRLSNQALFGTRCNSFVLDIACLARTLCRVRKLQASEISIDMIFQLQAAIKKLAQSSSQCKMVLTNNSIDYGITSQLEQALQPFWSVVMETLSTLTHILSTVPRFEPPPPSIYNYPGDYMVARKTGPDRYDVLAKCVLERESTATANQWRSKSTIFEHVNILCGGERVYDPNFFSRSKPQAKQFFTPGRVFTILWDTQDYDETIHEALERDTSVSFFRGVMTGAEGAFTGPFAGPTTSRHFMVFESGTTSSLCFPVSTFQDTGCATQPDQYNYCVIFTGLDTPMMLSDETDMVHPMLRIAKVPIWRPSPGIKGQREELPPIHSLPTNELPEKARVDLRRICEVDFNVQCRNIGLLDGNSMKWLLSHVS